MQGSRNHGLPRGLPLAPGVLLYRTKKPRKQANKADELAGELCLGAMEEGKDSEPGDNPSRSTWERGSNPPVCCLVGAARGDAALRVDSCCRVAFPVLFTLFNIAYWVSLTGWVTFGTANAAWLPTFSIRSLFQALRQWKGRNTKAPMESEPGETLPQSPCFRPSLPASLGYFLPFHHLRAWNRLVVWCFWF